MLDVILVKFYSVRIFSMIVVCSKIKCIGLKRVPVGVLLEDWNLPISAAFTDIFHTKLVCIIE